MKSYASLLLLLGVASSKYATTTRYWDCSGGSCGCGYAKNGNPVHCPSNAMFKAPAGNKYGAKFYGSAAISKTLGGDYWLAPGCGRCFKVTGRANVGSHTEYSTVVLKGTNYWWIVAFFPLLLFVVLLYINPELRKAVGHPVRSLFRLNHN